MRGRKLDLTGERFSRLVVLSKAEKRADGRIIWLCRCDCGRETRVAAANLRKGKTRSCGCLKAETVKVVGIKHGYFGTRIYRIWAGLNSRCLNPDNKDYPNYGGRGITVCEQWRSFANFHADMAGGYNDGLSIERIDVNGDYEPGNCRWATPTEQARNRRNNRVVEWRGRSMTIAAWADETGIPLTTIRSRLRNGWEIEKVLSEEPSRKSEGKDAS